MTASSVVLASSRSECDVIVPAADRDRASALRPLRTSMMLVRIFPVPDHEESRTFECAKCSFTEIVTVPDPLKSDAAGWVAGEPRPPK